LALDVSFLLAAELIRRGFQVTMTRKSDDFDKKLSTSDRCRAANDWKADCFVSIHLNSSQYPRPHGRELIYCPASERGHQLALAINSRFGDALHDRGVKTDEQLARGFRLGILWKTAMPAVIVEVCFISNDNDLAWILDPGHRKRAALSVAEGIEAWFDSEAALKDGGW
jgi:N-acetylmuramoyl-L-alanine amidase